MWSAETFSETYPAEPGSVSRARRALCDFAAGAGAGPPALEAVGLASSEALTNAVVHAYRGELGSVYATAAVASGELWVLIADDGCGLKARADRPGLGFGLGLIAQVTDELAVVARAHGGTELRMRFDLVRAEPGPPSSPSGSVGRRASPSTERSRSREPLR